MNRLAQQSRRRLWLLTALLIIVVLAWSGLQIAAAQPAAVVGQASNSVPMPCVAGMAGPYPCANVDLVGQLTLAEMGGGVDTKGNDIWGWTDPMDGKEYAIMGLTDGTAFVDVSDPANPLYLGTLPTHTTSSVWRDIKVYADHAFIVADDPSLHGMQVFDLTQLRTVTPPVTFSETAYYDQFGNGHNMFINEDTGYGYVVRTETCGGALHMIDLSVPTAPSFAGCYDIGGLTSDMQCIVYDGPDADYQGQELCFIGSDDAFTVGDVTDKANPVEIANEVYNGIGRVHQGWLTDDRNFFLLSDTFDESTFGHNTRTYMWDVADLDNIQYMGFYEATTAAVDHNVYIIGRYAYETNFRGGLRILDIRDVANGNLVEFAYFDTDPTGDSPVKSGAWSSYPWFDSGILIVSDTERGLFILDPDLPVPTDVGLSEFGPGPSLLPAGLGLLLIFTSLALGLPLWLRLRPTDRQKS